MCQESDVHDAGAQEEIEDFRRRIAEVDAAAVAAVNRRIEVVGELKRLKQPHGIGFVDQEQERRLLTGLVAANPGPMSEASLRAVMEAVCRGDEARGRRARGGAPG